MNGSARARTLSNRGGSITNLREHTLSQILRVLARFGPMSRADVAAQCGLQVTALTNLITDLRNRDLVAELPKGDPGVAGPSHVSRRAALAVPVRPRLRLQPNAYRRGNR
jgi:hypothetical protein